MRLALYCKNLLFGEALASLLSNEGNFDVIATSATPRPCITAAREQNAQAIVVDTTGLEKSDLEFLMGASAYANFGVVLIADDCEEYDSYEIDKLYSRAQGSQGLIKAIREVGDIFVRLPSGRVRHARADPNNKFDLSKREFEVASLVAKGYSNRKISQVVQLKEQSVKNLVSVIMRKLKCENRVQVALRLSKAKIEDEG